MTDNFTLTSKGIDVAKRIRRIKEDGTATEEDHRICKGYGVYPWKAKEVKKE